MSLATLAAWAAMVVASLLARGHLPADARLPMQWGIDGKPTWYASRDAAVALFPVVALCILSILRLSYGRTNWLVLGWALVFLAVHLGFLRFATRGAVLP